MSSPPQTPASSSQFGSILDAALREYKKMTGNDLLNNWLSKEVQSCQSVEAVLDVVQCQAEAFDEFRNGDKRSMKWIGPSVHVLYTISATLGEGVGMALPSAKAVFTGIGVLLAAANDVWASHDVLVDLFQRIQFFLRRLGVHTQISPTRDMVEILVKIMAEVISILSIATKEVQQSRTKAYIKKLLGRTDIEDALKRLDSLTQEEVRMAIAQVLKAMSELKDDAKKVSGVMQLIANNVGEIKDDVGKIKWNQIEQDVRKWFSPPDPSVNYNIACEAYQEGTAVWFFESGVFKEWELIGSLLWIHGKPGSGKSILCSAVIKHAISLRDAGNASLAYFFFDFRDKEKQNVRNFVTSLLIQLSAYSEPCCNKIFRLYSTHGKGAQQPSIGDLINCLKEMLKVAAQRPVYVIVDALDECPDVSGMPTPRETVLNLMEDLIQMQIPSLHVWITSRSEIDIKEVLEPLAYSAVSLHDESGQRKDISDYVRSVVYSDRKMRKWRDEEKKRVVEELSEKADGMFRWVFCQLEVLRHCLPASIRQTLDQLPETLDETYARVLSQIPEANQAHAHRLLQCLMVAVRPLRVEELAEVLAFEFDKVQGAIPRYRAGWRSNDQEQAVLSTCSSLISIVDDNGSHVVQFSHFSVKEFLMSDRLTSPLGDFSRYQILPGPAHTILAQACLGFLLHLNDPVYEEDGEDFPLARYAARHWVTHAQFEDVALRVKDGMESLFDCDKPHFAAWLGTYNIDDNKDEGEGEDEPYWESPSKIPGALLYYSSFCGFCDLVEHLAIKHPQHVNAMGGCYEFPLVAAIVARHIRVAEILLMHGANVDIRGMRKQTPLHEAITDVSTVQFLLNYGADVNCRKDDLRTPLHLAAGRRELEVARVLLEHGADVNSRDNEGKTPLHLVFEDEDRDDEDILDLARLFLEHGVDVNSRDEGNNTPLHLAMYWCMYKCARNLLEHGADASVENNERKTPLHLLFEKYYFDEDHILDLAGLLLENGAHVNMRTTNEGTLLHAAAFRGWLEIAKVLLNHGASTSVKNDQGETPLHVVSRDEYIPQGRCIGIAQLLLEHGVDVHAQDKDHNTALHLATVRGRLDIVRVLLDHGATMNAENNPQEPSEVELHPPNSILTGGPGLPPSPPLTTIPFTDTDDVFSPRTALPSVETYEPPPPYSPAADSTDSLALISENNSFLDELDPLSASPELKKEGSDWLAIFNPKTKRALDVNHIYTLHHESVVCCVKFSPNGKYLATGCNRTAQIFDVKTGTKTCVLLADYTANKGVDLYVRTVCFSPDGKYLATGTEDPQIRIWDITKRRIRNVFAGHTREIYSLAFSPDGRLIISGSGDCTARIWDLQDGSNKILEDRASESADSCVSSVTISPDGRLVATGSLDNTVRIWDVVTGQLIERLRGHEDGVYTVAFTPDGDGIISGSIDKTLKYWDIGKLLANAPKRDPRTGLLPVGPLCSSSVVKRDGNEASATCTMNFLGHKDYVLSVTVSRDGQWVVSGSKDRGVQFWDSRSAIVQFMLQGHKNSVISVDQSPSASLFATGSGDWVARIWSYNTV